MGEGDKLLQRVDARSWNFPLRHIYVASAAFLDFRKGGRLFLLSGGMTGGAFHFQRRVALMGKRFSTGRRSLRCLKSEESRQGGKKNEIVHCSVKAIK
jgi:hypothetical protein